MTATTQRTFKPRSDGAGRNRVLLAIAKSSHEIVLFFAAVGLVLIALALVSHSSGDPAWSTTGTGAPIQNWMREPGAVLSNILYFLFGFSGWWLYLLGWRVWWVSLQWRLSFVPGESQSVAAHAVSRVLIHWLRYAPFRRLRDGVMLCLLMCASTILEWSHLYQYESWLPDQAGGVLGQILGPWMRNYLGANGTSLLAIVALVIAIASVFGFSWLRSAEMFGRGLDRIWMVLYGLWDSRQDMRIGRQAQRHREVEPFLEPGSSIFEDDDVDDKKNSGMHVSAGKTRKKQSTYSDSGPDSDFPPDERATHERMAAVGNTFESTQATMQVNTSSHHNNNHNNNNTIRHSDDGNNWVNAKTEPEMDIDFLLDDVPAVGQPSTTALTPSSFDAQKSVQESQIQVVPTALTQADTPSAPIAPSHSTQPSTAFTKATRLPVAHSKTARSFVLPHLDLLDLPATQHTQIATDTLETTSRLIEQRLKEFGIAVKVLAATPGPVVTRYEFEPATGVKGAQIVNLSKDLARSLSLISIRVIETIPGKNLMALELPNPHRQTIRLSEVLGTAIYENAADLLVMGLGKDIVGQPVVADLTKMPHCLVAGTTGSGKSVGINAMILSLLFRARPDEVRLMLIDPKMLEMGVYEGIPHLLCPVVTDMKQAVNGLHWCVTEMENRYKLMSKLGVRHLAGYNTKIEEAQARKQHIPHPFSLTPEQPEPLERLPYIVVVIDELADLMMVAGKRSEELIARLAQKARAAGIHLILATQRPSVDVITGLIKANVPARIAFQVSSKIDSRTIIDQMGAETLLGMGDMLYMPSGTGYPIRVHGAFVSDDEIHRVVTHLKEQCSGPNYIEGILEAPVEAVDQGLHRNGAEQGGMASVGHVVEKDPLYDQAVEIVLRERKATIAYMQYRLNVNNNRAARLLEDMEKAGLVGPMTSGSKRDILVPQRSE